MEEFYTFSYKKRVKSGKFQLMRKKGDQKQMYGMVKITLKIKIMGLDIIFDNTILIRIKWSKLDDFQRKKAINVKPGTAWL